MTEVHITSSWLRQRVREQGGVLSLTIRTVIAG